MTEKMNDVKELIIRHLRHTEREGIDNLIDWMEQNGFFECPCSTKYHLAEPGGLAEHSLNVYEALKTVKCSLEDNGLLKAEINKDTIRIVALLHDLGKCGDFGKQNYIRNYVRSKSKNKETGEYEQVISTAQPYKSNSELYYTDHEIRSIKIISRFIELTEEEEQAILWHNGLYSKFRNDIPGKETPLYMLLHFADMWASRVIEVEPVIEQEPE